MSCDPVVVERVRIRHVMVTGVLAGLLFGVLRGGWVLFRASAYAAFSGSLIQAGALFIVTHVEACCIGLSVATGLGWLLWREALDLPRWRRWCVAPTVTAAIWFGLTSWYVGPWGEWSEALSKSATRTIVALAACVPLSAVPALMIAWLTTSRWARGRCVRAVGAGLLVGLLLACLPVAGAARSIRGHRRASGARERLVAPSGAVRGVVLVVVDTLRVDHLSCMGSKRVRTPVIDELAREGVVFTQAVSQGPWTPPAMGTVMTSHYPSVHGAGGHREGISPDVPTLAEILSGAGWTTAAFVPNATLHAFFGFARGFGRYDMRRHFRAQTWQGVARDLRTSWPLAMFEIPMRVGPDGEHCVDRQIIQRAVRWLRTDAERPFFLWLQLMAVHDYIDLYAVRVGPEGDLFSPDDPIPSSSEGVRAVDLDKGQKANATMGDWQAWYAANVMFDDLLLGDLIQGLRDLGVLEDTLFILTSDHGEEFGDHGARGHGHTLYDELVHVPLILSYPKRLPRGKRVNEQVRLIDLMPTVLDVAGLSVEHPLCGESLLDLIESDGEGGRVAFSEFDDHQSLEAVRVPTRKLILRTADASVEYYDLADDPAEQSNLAPKSGQNVTAMRKAYVAWRSRVSRLLEDARPAHAQVDADLKARLEALGYVVTKDGGVRAH